jgi:periplasmic divalent cation tolerance protein
MVLLVTAGSEKQAAAIARALLAERLAACVNIWPARSLLPWVGEVQDDREYLMLVKTRASLAARVERRVKELHSYEVPEVVAFSPLAGSQPYLRWILDSTGRPAGPRTKRPTRDRWAARLKD